MATNHVLLISGDFVHEITTDKTGFVDQLVAMMQRGQKGEIVQGAWMIHHYHADDSVTLRFDYNSASLVSRSNFEDMSHAQLVDFIGDLMRQHTNNPEDARNVLCDAIVDMGPSPEYPKGKS